MTLVQAALATQSSFSGAFLQLLARKFEREGDYPVSVECARPGRLYAAQASPAPGIWSRDFSGTVAD
jgi:hypothetical protein